jgi:hypothetical protein
VEINARTIDEAATAVSDPWSAIVAAFDAFLGTIADPSASGFASSAPASLGLEDCWAWREGTEIDLIRRQLDRVAQAGALLVEEVDMLARVLFGWSPGGVLAMDRAADPKGGAGAVPHGDAPGHARNGADGRIQGTME